MKTPRHAGLWIPSMRLCLVVVLLLVTGLAPAGVRGVGQEPEFEKAPMAPVTVVPHPPGTGYLPPEMDLSHLTGQALPRGAMPEQLPAAFDWRTSGMVTPVKNQADCGSCYAFAFVGSFESKLLMDGAGTWDLSENHAKECNWREVSNYQYPPGNPWGSCNGGNSFMIADLYSQTGSVLETCNPYVASDVACSAACPHQQSVLDWRLISGGSVPSTEVLKQYIHDHGPVATSVYVDEAQGFNATYDGSTTLNYSSPAGYLNHGVVIVGWSNNLPPVPGGFTPADGWIVKNSWGTGWGAGGYFYMTYGTGNIGTGSSFVYDWQPYDSEGDLWFYDEDGWNGALGQSGGANMTAWGLAKYIPDSNTNVTRVEFWTTDSTTDVDVYLYDNFDGTSTSNLLASKLDNSFAEAGYHSVALDSPVPVTTGNDINAVVKFTNSSSGYPLSFDANGPGETARTYASLNGTSWTDLSSFDCDATIRLRTSAGAILAPTVTSITPTSGQNTGTVHVTDLAGSNFQSGATVKLTRSGQIDINATGVVVVNSSQITCDLNLAGAAPGAWNVVVTNPDTQSGTLSNGFSVTAPTPPPTVTGMVPNSGPNTGSLPVTIAGTNFQAGASVKLTRSGQIDINATGVVVVNSSQITCDLDLAGAATGDWHVVVTNPDMQSGTLENGFTVTSPDGVDYFAYLPLILGNLSSNPVTPRPPTLNPIENADEDGNYTVSWSAVSGATSYTLQEDDNSSFTSPTAVYSGSATSRAISGRAPGTYYYRVNASDAASDSDWSNTRSVVVAASGPNPGFWRTAGVAVEFYVTSDRAYVDDFAIDVDVEGCGSYKITDTLREPIVSSHFSFSGSFYGNGTFSSSTSCSGTTGLDQFYIAGCGYVSGGPWSYTAIWQGTEQPTHGEGQVSVVAEKVDEDAIESFLTAEMALP